jgi:hypothetical protein
VPEATDPAQRRIIDSSKYLVNHMRTEPPVLILVYARRPLVVHTPRGAGASLYPAVQEPRCLQHVRLAWEVA